MSNLGFLALGYGLIWVLIGAYVFFISRKQATLRRHLEQLQMDVESVTEKMAQRTETPPQRSSAEAQVSAGVAYQE